MPASKKRKTMSTEAKLKRLEKKVRDMDRAIEVKEKSFSVQAAAPAGTATNVYNKDGYVQRMLQMSRGSLGTDGEFIGDQITLDRMWLRYCNSFQGFNCNYRVAVVWDKEGGTAPLAVDYTDIFHDDVVNEGDLPLAGINLKNRDRFEILYDSINSRHRNSQMQLSVSQAGDVFRELVRDTGEAYIDLKGKVCTFPAGEVGQALYPTTGNLLLVTIASTGEAPTTPGGAPVITGCDRFVQMQARIRYKDA